MNCRKILSVATACCGLALATLGSNAAFADARHNVPSTNEIGSYYAVVSSDRSAGSVTEQYNPDGSFIRATYAGVTPDSVNSVTLFAEDGSQIAAWHKGQPLDAASAKIVTVDQPSNQDLKITIKPGNQRTYEIQYYSIYALGWMFSSHVTRDGGTYELGITSYDNSLSICALSVRPAPMQEFDAVARADGTIQYVETTNEANSPGITSIVLVKDATGKKNVYAQEWTGSNISGLVEYDAAGVEKRLLLLDPSPPVGGPNIVTDEMDLNVTISGVTYTSAIYRYRSDGSLASVEYYKKDTHAVRTVSFPQAVQIKAVVNDSELNHP